MNTQGSYFSYMLDEFKNIYQQTTYQNKGNYLDVSVIHFKRVS